MSKGAPYYDLRLTMIPGAEIYYHGEPGDEDYRESVCNCFGRTITQQELGDLYGNDERPVINIEDNGIDGNGIFLTVTNPLWEKDKYPETPDETIACVMIPDQSLPLIIEALQTVYRLRQAQAEGLKDVPS